jgi:hypothetical protein
MREHPRLVPRASSSNGNRQSVVILPWRTASERLESPLVAELMSVLGCRPVRLGDRIGRRGAGTQLWRRSGSWIAWRTDPRPGQVESRHSIKRISGRLTSCGKRMCRSGRRRWVDPQHRAIADANRPGGPS